jgi:hypothetical protein
LPFRFSSSVSFADGLINFPFKGYTFLKPKTYTASHTSTRANNTKILRNRRVSFSLLAIISANGSGEVVDKVRLALESSSAGWFRLVKYAGYAVAIGCAMEALEHS